LQNQQEIQDIIDQCRTQINVIRAEVDNHGTQFGTGSSASGVAVTYASTK
jgi:hypothetical protein